MVGRWRFLVAVVVSVFAFAGTAQASPLFLSAINISDAGPGRLRAAGRGRQHRATCMPSGRAPTAPTSGSSTRLARRRRAGAPRSTISDPGQSASDAAARRRPVEQHARGLDPLRRHEHPHPGRVQAGGRQLRRAGQTSRTRASTRPSRRSTSTTRAGRSLVWQRFDGANAPRAGAPSASAGAGGTFENEMTLSDPGQDALRPAESPRARTWTRTASSSGTAPTARTCGCSPPAAATTSGTRGRWARPRAGRRWCRLTTSAPRRTAPTGRRWCSRRATRRCTAPRVLTVGTPDANGVRRELHRRR